MKKLIALTLTAIMAMTLIPQAVFANGAVTIKETKVDNLALEPTVTARDTLIDNITIENGYGRTVKLQMQSGSSWVDKGSFAMTKDEVQDVSIEYPEDWWYVRTSKWRIVIDETEEVITPEPTAPVPEPETSVPVTDGIASQSEEALSEDADTSEGADINVTKYEAYTSDVITITTKDYYKNPSGWFQIQDKLTLKGGGYTLYRGYMGLKVRKVNRYFRIGSKYWPRYTLTTYSKVKKFQKRKRLRITGNVNLETWKKMGFSESDWYNMGAYVTPKDNKITPASDRSDYVNAMIRTANNYRGADYVVGASGKKSQGLDCSGLIMQCMYAAGIGSDRINPVSHSKKGHEYESRNLWKCTQLKRVSYKNKKPGDLIFYSKRSKIIHVAIYTGNGKIVHSWPNKVIKSRINNKRWGRIHGVKRVLTTDKPAPPEEVVL
ncbi:MAG: NlpC/P60 family protein [Lentihominibacter sp.]